jgi:hypothetical protein
MSQYNLEKLVKVSTHNIFESGWYKFKKEIKFFNITFRSEGVYDRLNHYVGLNPPEEYCIKDGVVYYKPQVELKFQGDVIKQVYFDTIDEAKEYEKNITDKGNWLLIK